MPMSRQSPVWVSLGLALFIPGTAHISQKSGGNLPPKQGHEIDRRPTITPLTDYIAFYVQLPGGQLMGISETLVNGVRGGQARARYSSDNGRTWSDAQTLFTLPKKDGEWIIHNVLLDRDGELHFFFTLSYKVGPGNDFADENYDVWHIRSTDGRKNWRPPHTVWKGFYGSMNSVTQLRSGRILLPVCFLTARTWRNPGQGLDAFTDAGRFSSKVGYSDDDGDTWRLSEVEFKTSMPYIGATGMIEPSVIELKDGQVWLLIRTQNGRFYEAYSRDGSDWSHARPTKILSSDSPAPLVRLRDGRILMFWNNCLRYPYAQGGRFVIHAAISENEGQTWRGYREVARDPRVGLPHPTQGDFGVSYLWPVETKDRKVVFNVPVNWPGYRPPGRPSRDDNQPSAALFHFDPDWLYETTRSTDFSAGLDDWSYFGTKGVALVPIPQTGGQALQIHKVDIDWPASAVWNFPMGRTGTLRLKIFLNKGFAGARLGLTDHFSVPFDEEDAIYNLFNLTIGQNGALENQTTLEPGYWHDLVFNWNNASGLCHVTADGKPIALLHTTREAAPGVSYLRIVSTAEKADNSGLLVGSVTVDVSASWTN